MGLYAYIARYRSQVAQTCGFLIRNLNPLVLEADVLSVGAAVEDNRHQLPLA